MGIGHFWKNRTTPTADGVHQRKNGGQREFGSFKKTEKKTAIFVFRHFRLQQIKCYKRASKYYNTIRVNNNKRLNIEQNESYRVR